MKTRAIPWLPEPEAHDYPAAASYLTLVYTPERVAALVDALKAVPVVGFKAKDLFRASGLSLLGISNSHVARNLDKMKGGQALSPLLLVREPDLAKVIIADGYHRLCAVYTHDEDALIPCKIV